MKKWLLSLLIILTVFMFGVPAFAETGDPATPLESGIDALAGETGTDAEETGKNFIYELTVDRKQGTVTAAYSAEENAHISVKVYNDYQDETEKKLLFTLGPVFASKENESVTLSLPKNALPDYFELESEITTVSGETTGYQTSIYTEDLQFALNATETDFPDGYYVKIDASNAPKLSKMPGLMKSAAPDGTDAGEMQDGTAEGYFVYNTDLVLLSDDVPYTLTGEGEDRSVVFDSIPEELAGMTEQEIKEMKGFVIPAANVADADTFLLNGGVTVTPDGLSMKLAEPTSIDDLYAMMNVTMLGALNAAPERIDTAGVKGTVTRTQDFEVKIVRNGWKLNLQVSIGVSGSFQLTMSRPTFDDNIPSFYADPEGQVKLAGPIKGSVSLNYKGFGMTTDTSFYGACNAPVYIEGDYGFLFYFRVGFSGLKYGSREEDVEFRDVVPLTPNRDTYAYFARSYRFHLLGFYFDFKLFDIGPVFDLYFDETVAGRALARWDQLEEKQQPGEDIIHTCIQPVEGPVTDASGMPTHGCISGMAGSVLKFSMNFGVDLFFWDKTWKIAERIDAPDEPDVDYFYHSLTFGDKKWEHGKSVTCPHQLYRISAHTTENVRNYLPDSVISSAEGAIDLNYSVTTTNERGIADPIYLTYVPNKTYTLKAVDKDGNLIAEEDVTPQDLIRHRRIVFDRNSTIITQVNLDGWFPHAVGNTLYAGKSVSTGKDGKLIWHYRPYVTYEKGSGSSGDYGDGMDIGVRWTYRVNGVWEEHYPETETRLSAQEGINRCEIELDFTTFGDGTARLTDEEDLWVLIMGQEGGNPVRCNDDWLYRFGITGYQVEDKICDNGDVRKNCILKIQAEFVVGDEDYVLVKVKDGLTAVSSHMYRSGDTAVVIGRDIGDTRYTIISELVPKLSPETWSPTEKEELKAEVFRQGPVDDPFGRWVQDVTVTEAAGMLPFPSAYSPIITPDGVISYNTATFTVPEFTGTKKELVVRAVYDRKDLNSINWINTDIKAPVPGESFGNVDDGYTVGKMTTDPGECHVEGVSGENAGEVKLSWTEDGNKVNGKIRYNTVYTVTGTLRPQMNVSTYYRFRYPLASQNGTKAYITPVISGKAGQRDEALSFESVSQYPEEVGDDLPVADDETAVFTYLFITPMAQLLEVIQPDDLYYPVGIQPEVINEYLRRLNIGIITEDETVTSSDAKWEKVTEVPGAGEQFTVSGTLLLPDGIRNEEEAGHHKVDESVKVTIHIYGADELEPPAADPVPGIYRRDIQVALTHSDADAIIRYRVLGKDGEFKEYTETIPFKCEEGRTVTYTVEAYAEKTVPAEKSPSGEAQTLTSERVTFTYVLMPRGGDFVLTVTAGSASSSVVSGSGQLHIPAGTEVTLSPIEDETLEFDHWGLDHTPAGFSWNGGTDKTTPNARFNMPPEDLTVTGYYMPKKGERIISAIQLQMEEIELGYTKEQMPEHDNRSTIRLDYFDKRSEMPGMVWLRFNEATNLWWEEGCVYPVTYGTYAFDAMYLINSEKEEPVPGEDREVTERTMPMGLVELSQKQLPSQSVPYDYWVKETDRFAPYLTATVNGNPASVIVSEDGKRAMVHYEFDFPPKTYKLRYDANGGVLSEVPPQVIQLIDIPTALTDKEPYHDNGRRFLGWSTDPAATEPEYVYDPAQEPPVTFDKDTTLYAVWGPPYGAEIRWLDADNAANTRQSFTVSFADGTTLTVDPKDATEINGVGIERYDLPELSAAYADTATVDGEENGFIRFTDVDGKRNVYAVEKNYKDGQLVITLTAKRLFGVEKKWNIDFEDHDRPKSVKMILQSNSPVEDESSKLMRLLMEYLSDSSAENRDKIISELEKIIGYSLKGLSPEAVAGKVMHLIVSGQFSASNLTDSLKKLLTADTDDSKGWYAWQTVKVGEDNGWKADFRPTDRFEGKITVNEDGSLSAEWNGERKYRIVEKGGKTPVENGGDAVFTVPEYTNIVGKVIEEHKTVYEVKYSSKNDITTVTNTAVEDHYLLKEWAMLGDAKKPENVYVLLMWQYDSDYLNAVQDMIDVELPSLWLPEDNPLKGSMISVYDIIASIDPTGLSSLLKPILGKLKIPLAIAKLNEGNNWRGYFRVKKYGNFGLPLKHEGAEFFSAICQDVIKYFFGVDIPIGVNPLQGFISVSVPEVDVPFTTDKLDAVVNTWYKGPDDPDDPEDKPNKIGGAKIWEDDSNKDGIRPEKITLHIYEDGVNKIADITVTRADNAALDGKNYWVWVYKNDRIDTKHHTYTVTEDPIEGYETKINGLNVTNTHTAKEQKYVDLSVTKTWDEETPATHDPITAKIMRNGKLFRTVILSKENAWTQKLTDLEKVDETGRTYTYSVEEETIPEGYTVSYDVHFDSAGNEWVCYITNKPADPEKTVIKGKKIWDDDNDKYAARPESVTVRLHANGTEIAAFELNEKNAWSWSYEVDPADEAGETIKYTVTEDTVEGYETKIDGLNVTNRMTVPPEETVDIEVIKNWEETDDTHPAVPVTLQLLRNGEPYGSTFVLDETNGWEKLFEKVERKDADGRDYAYAVKETPVPDGFAESYDIRFDTARSRFILTVTNKAVSQDEKKIGGTKTWDDGNNVTGMRPVSVEYLILANGIAVDRKVLNANTGWAWSGAYPVADEKGQIAYSVMESPVPYYTAEYSDDGLSVTNKLTLATITVNKRWQDGNNAGNIRPDKVEVAVLAAVGKGEPEEIAAITLTGGAAENTWSGSVNVVATDEYGQARSFSIREIDITDYVVTYDEPIHDAAKHTWTFGITNTLVGTLQITNTVLHGDKTTPIPFTVELTDGSGNGYSGKIEAELNHVGETSPVTLSFIKGKASVSLAHGDSILLQDVTVGWRYTVRETSPYGYRTWAIDPDNEIASPVKLMRTLLAAPEGDGYPAYTTAIKKYGANTADFYNDTGFTVTGLKLIDGKAAGADVEGLFTFELLYGDMTPVMDENGVPIQAVNAADGTFVMEAAIALTGKSTFYVRELSDVALSEKYVMDTAAHPVTVEADANGKLIASPDPVTINNSTLTTLTVYKKWVGSDGGAIMLDLYANGSAVSGHTPVRNGNTYTFAGLPRTDENGNEIIWSAKERPVEGFDTSYHNTGAWSGKKDAAYDQCTIVNRKTVSIIIYKEWKGKGKHPDSITLNVYCDGEFYRSETRKPHSDGSITLTLPMYNHNGEEAVYTFTEQPIKNYKTKYRNVSPYGNVKDKLYAGGTIVNYRTGPVPPTGDKTPVIPLMLINLCAAMGLGVSVVLRRRRKA